MKRAVAGVNGVVLAILLAAAAWAAEPATDPSAAGQPPPAAMIASRSRPSALAPALPAQPAAAKSNPHQKPMTVTLVRSGLPGCAPHCPEWIAAEGMIDSDTLPRFKKVLKALSGRKLPVLINSNGGLVDESLSIGRLLRSKALDVGVANTVITPCADGDGACKSAGPAGQAKAYLARCASSCAFILAGGVHRYAGLRTPVGVHQLKSLQTTAKILQKFRIEHKLVWGIPTETKRTLISQQRINERTVETKTPASAYAKVAAYFREMGVGEAVMPMLKNTPHTSIHWLTRAELVATNMATDTIDGEQLIAALGKPAVPAAAAAVPAPVPAQAP